MATTLIPPANVPEGITLDRLESDAGLFEVVHGEIRNSHRMASTLIPPANVPEGITLDRLESDAGLFEVVHGEILEKPLSAFSTWLGNQVFLALAVLVKERKLGTVVQEMIFILDEDRFNQPRPDVAFVSVERWPLDRLPPYHGYWHLVPNLAIEVVSPSDRFEDVVEKAELYLEFGVDEVWLVVPRTRSVVVYRQGNAMSSFAAGDTLTTSLIPGWALEVGKLIPPVSSERDAPAV